MKSLSGNKEKTIWHQICDKILNFRYLCQIRASFFIWSTSVSSISRSMYYTVISLSLSLSVSFFLCATVKLSLALIRSLMTHSFTAFQTSLLKHTKKSLLFFLLHEFWSIESPYLLCKPFLSLSHSYFKQFHSLFSLKPCFVAENQRDPILQSSLHCTEPPADPKSYFLFIVWVSKSDSKLSASSGFSMFSSTALFFSVFSSTKQGFFLTCHSHVCYYIWFRSVVFDWYHVVLWFRIDVVHLH